MKQNREFPFAKVTKKQEYSLKKGHPWIYEDEITEESGTIENGCLIDVFGTKGNYLGTGFYSALSKIRIRLLGTNANEKYDDAFFERRVRYALEYRKDVMGEDYQACRLIHGEADGLPGLTVDRYQTILVSEIASYGTEMHKDVIYHSLLKLLKEQGETIEGIYERNEGDLRAKEGLKQYKGWYGEEHPDSCITEICENGIYYEVDVENGQKTGFFLDQKYNRLAVKKLAHGKRVLDCCTHTGSFALNAANGGAEYVLAVDISESALDMARKNAERNHLNLAFRQGDVFEILPQLRQEHAQFDFIILDPPAFTKSRKTFHNAKGGYKQINKEAMRLLGRGGYLASASCSHFMPRDEFRNMLSEAAAEAGVSIRIIEERHAAPDHPVLPNVPETEYLKFFMVQII
ncbi:MAG: class I SAM-dependent rRNA methyltransferase [Solobacterium sp.]|nr:class I SAM-dependent rRNA methyltransferase [Solobacterium sp.]